MHECHKTYITTHHHHPWASAARLLVLQVVQCDSNKVPLNVVRREVGEGAHQQGPLHMLTHVCHMSPGQAKVGQPADNG